MTTKEYAERTAEWICCNPDCNGGTRIQIHHIIPKRKGGPNESWNYISLCAKCHHHFEGKEHLKLFAWKCMFEIQKFGFVYDEREKRGKNIFHERSLKDTGSNKADFNENSKEEQDKNKERIIPSKIRSVRFVKRGLISIGKWNKGQYAESKGHKFGRPYFKRNCLVCNEPFNTNKNIQIYCSQKCNWDSWDKKHPRKGIKNDPARLCHREINPHVHP